MPAWIKLSQFPGCARMHLAPVRASLVAFEDFLGMGEVVLVGHTLVHMYCEVTRLALIGRTEPDIIAMNETTLQWKMHPELVLFDTRLNLVDDSYGMFRRAVLFHLPETHHAPRPKHAPPGTQLTYLT